jgi:D-arginine dehydrogenase
MSQGRFDVIVVGAGIAGASVAYFLTARGVTNVLLVEREEQPGCHATGRSAAVLVELDPNATVQHLKVLSASFLRQPPSGFSSQPLLERSGILLLFRGPMWEALQQAAPTIRGMGVRLKLFSPAEAVERVPVLAGHRLDGAVLLPEDGHIDVHELLWSYLRHAQRRGAKRRLRAEVLGIRVERGRCAGVLTSAGEFRADWVVNAAGAWAGRLGQLAGAAPISLVPHRRTIAVFAAPDDLDVSGWPFVTSDVDKVYFGPESGGLLLSPMDEEPVEPCDAQAEHLVIAEALERLRTVAAPLVPRSLRRAWAGLRTFAADRVPVVGEDPRLPGFFWLAGQGGSGIETSPIIGQIAVDLLLSGNTDRFDAQVLAPSRFGLTD